MQIIYLTIKLYKKFCKDIEEQYDDKFGFESKLNKVRSEIDSVTSSLSIARGALHAQPVIGLSLRRLFAEGIGEHDIIELANLFERSNDADKQALLGGLLKYRKLKRGVVILNEEIEGLKHKVFGLQLAKQSLGEAKQTILLMIARSKDVVALLQDPFNHTEEEDGNVKILKMIYLFLQ